MAIILFSILWMANILTGYGLIGSFIGYYLGCLAFCVFIERERC